MRRPSRVWRPTLEERDVRQLVLHRHRLVQVRARVKNQLQALAGEQREAHIDPPGPDVDAGEPALAKARADVKGAEPRRAYRESEMNRIMRWGRGGLRPRSPWPGPSRRRGCCLRRAP